MQYFAERHMVLLCKIHRGISDIRSLLYVEKALIGLRNLCKEADIKSEYICWDTQNQLISRSKDE